jgi:hypothetical protein
MCEHDHLPELPLPDLCDDCAIAILDFFYELLTVYESRYGDQIRNYYDDRSDHNSSKPDLNPLDDDPPF